MDCPRCGLANPASATRCDCGYDLTRPSAEQRVDRAAHLARARGHRRFGLAVAVGAPVLGLLSYLGGGWFGSWLVWASPVVLVLGLRIFATADRQVREAERAREEEAERG